jgi:hypothetical protein
VPTAEDTDPKIVTPAPGKTPSGDEEQPLSKREPSAPFALVGLTYMAILAVLVMVMAAYYFFR